MVQHGHDPAAALTPAAVIVHSLEAVQVDPEVVGVEKLVLGHILKCILILIGGLGRLAQNQATTRLALCQVPTLLVCACPLSHLRS